ncbi:MAG TPA: putative peptidoglycan binding domain-containing protein, partial [Candidatus Elarobacter sp.]|nr:putative peptidoglycan binding domain-containing protein [Candidatus Elarobacter sp.]
YGGFNDRYVDLRVDDHSAPIGELARLLELHKLYHFPAAAGDVLAIDDTLGREIVSELVRVGALTAREGAGFDDAARDALVAFMHVENLENRVRADRTIDRQTLGYLRAFRSASERRS